MIATLPKNAKTPGFTRGSLSAGSAPNRRGLPLGGGLCSGIYVGRGVGVGERVGVGAGVG